MLKQSTEKNKKKGNVRAKFQQYALARKTTLGVSGCPRMSCSKLTSLLPAAGKFPVPIGGSALFQFNQLPPCSGFGLSCPSCTPEVSWSENSEPSSPFLHVLPYPACPNSAGRGLHPCCLATSCKANRQCLHSWLGTLPARWQHPSPWACTARVWEWGMPMHRTAYRIVWLDPANNYISILESKGCRRWHIRTYNHQLRTGENTYFMLLHGSL